MSHLNFTRDDSPIELERDFTNIIDEFVQPESKTAVDSAAERIIRLLPKRTTVKEDTHDFYVLGQVYRDLAEQIPYDHPSLLKFSRLIETVQRESWFKFKDADGDPLWVHGRFKECVVEDWDSVPNLREPRQYLNFQAFVANVMDLGVLINEVRWAVEIQRVAHEDDCPQLKEDERETWHDLAIIGAAQWIIWGGQDMFKQVLYHGSTYPTEWPFEIGPKYNGGAGLSIHRWHFWRDGYRAAASRTAGKECKFGEERKKIASKAADLMDSFEKNMTF